MTKLSLLSKVYERGIKTKLPLLSKVYERVMYEQTSNYFKLFFNDILCGFRKAHNA